MKNTRSVTIYTGSNAAITAAVAAALQAIGITGTALMASRPKSSGHRITKGAYDNHDNRTAPLKLTTPAQYCDGDYIKTHAHFDAFTQLGELIVYLTVPGPLLIGADEVEFLAGGDVKVGCTTVPSALFEQIAERRKETI